MNRTARGAIVPFFAFLFPMIWYINRNLGNEVLVPHVDPTPALFLGALVGAVGSAAVLATLASVLGQRVLADPRDDGRRSILEPGDRALAVYAVEVTLLALWALPALAGIGPALLETALTPLVALLGVPLFVVLPLALEASPGAHVLFVLGLMASALWMAVLASVVAGRIGDGAQSGGAVPE